MDLQDLGAELIRIGSKLRLGHSPQDSGIPDEVRLAMLFAAARTDVRLPVETTQDTGTYTDESGNTFAATFNRKFTVTLFPVLSAN